MTKQDFIDQMTARRSALLQFRLALGNVTLKQEFIVECEGIPLSFTVTNNRANDPRPTQPEEATRFSRRDAQNVATQVINGHGTKATAIRLHDALDVHIIRLTEAIDRLEQQS